MAMVTASLQNFVLKYEVQLLGRPPSDFAPTETGGEVLWRLTEARKLAAAMGDDPRLVPIMAAIAQGMNIGHF